MIESKLGDIKDIKERKQLRVGSMKKMKEILKAHSTDNIKRRQKVNKLISEKCFLLNDCGMWGISAKYVKTMNRLHKKQCVEFQQ